MKISHSHCCKVGDFARTAIGIMIVFVALQASIALGVNQEPKKEMVVKDRIPQTLEEAVKWLEQKSREMIRASARTTKSGIAAFPPQVGSGYEAFWLRDYAYMLDGAVDAFSDKELKDSYLFFVSAIRADGASVDCVKFDGTPIYQPGYGTMGKNPVADGSQFLLDVAWRTWKKTGDAGLIEKTIDKLVLTMNAVPRDRKSGLVYIEPGEEQERCPYGFTDSICKQGEDFFDSLLFIQASRQLADLLDAAGRKPQADQWRKEADRVASHLTKAFWDESVGLYRAATVRCREHDLWGSAFAVYLGVSDKNQAQAIARYFKNNYDGIIKRGQLRHTPKDVYWEKTYTPHGRYQNGAYWATPIGWFAYTLDLVDSRLADRTVVDMVKDFITVGDVNECVNDGYSNVPNYIVSAALPLDGIREMQSRRKSRE